MKRGIIAAACGLALSLGPWPAAQAHPNHDDDDFKEDMAEILRMQGKPCFKILSMERSGNLVVVTCQQSGSNPSMKVQYTIGG